MHWIISIHGPSLRFLRPSYNQKSDKKGKEIKRMQSYELVIIFFLERQCVLCQDIEGANRLVNF